VTSGQNPSTIAKRYGVKVNDLFQWNNWEKGHALHIGDEVTIHTNWP
jgi:LysM repeat protein